MTTNYILNIHTATEIAIVNLSDAGRTIHSSFNIDTKQHATFLHNAIHDLVKSEGITLKDVSAVGVTSGPGSYTGIRVGLSAAKGICYALKIPLITYNSLELIARSSIDFTKETGNLYCPMIDARRMEVYTAIYRSDMGEVEAPSAKILDENSFIEYVNRSKIIFSGSGSKKFKNIVKAPGFYFADIEIATEALTFFSWQKYQKKAFENVDSAKPLYLKEFQTAFKKE
ncbi:MAG: tRNA (adenosine(37)-N6)-threonylcarbamoyltransferase complex dimerization subunit type 1 TsaB [Ginsengibacter sp.]